MNRLVSEGLIEALPGRGMQVRKFNKEDIDEILEVRLMCDEFLYSRPFYKEVLGYVPKVFGAESIVKCSAKVGYDFVIIPMGGVSGFGAKEDSGTIYTDEWGITYEKNPSTWPIDATIK